MVDDITGPLRRRYPAHLHDELEPVGRHGLVLAALAFEDTGAVAFASYGWKRIANYIRAELRKRSFGASDLAPEHMDPEGGDGADSCPVEDGYLDSMHAAVTGEASRLATRSPEEALAELRERERTSTILRQTRARLDKRARRVVRLRHDWDLEWKKIAAILDVSQATARRDYGAAVRRLRRKMRAVGVTPPSWSFS